MRELCRSGDCPRPRRPVPRCPPVDPGDPDGEARTEELAGTQSAIGIEKNDGAMAGIDGTGEARNLAGREISHFRSLNARQTNR
jgi:hypothetical protein